MSMQEKVVIVTGAAQGIGQAIALKFAAEGARVAIFDVLEPKKTVKQVEGMGGSVIWKQVDVADETEVQKAFNDVISKWGKVDILVNNAGIYPIERIEQMSVGLFKRIFDVNVIGPFICSQLFVKALIDRNSPGKIINIASAAGVREELFHGAYSASKSALISLTKAMALELGRRGILVNAIAPGAIQTKGTKLAVPFPETGGLPEEFMAYQKQKFGLIGRMGKPEEVANLVHFLASPSGDYMTGAVISFDGGRTLL